MTKWVLRLIVANFVLFLLAPPGTQLFGMLAFVPAWILIRPWTLFTYMFLHASWAHIIFNMLGLFFFGPSLEARLGSRDFLLLYFLSGLGGAVLSFFFQPMASVVGASGAVFGILLGFAYFWPRQPIYIWGILPIQARVLVIILAVMSIYSGFVGGGGNIAHFAHLGGFVAGWAFLSWRQRRVRKLRQIRTGPSIAEVVSGQLRQEEERWRSIPLDDLHEINRLEVERILRKLDSDGLRSITPEERAFMNRMSM